MIKAPIDADEVLKNMASEAVKQGANLRVAIRDLTLNALRSRELSLAQIKQVLKSITEGVSLGTAGPKVDVEDALEAALAGMDDALLKAVQANQIALEQLASHGQSFREAHVKKALDDLERLEDHFLKTVKQTAGRSGEKVREQWASVLQQKELAGTDTGAQATAILEQFSDQMQTALRAQRRATLKAAQVLSENFTTLASGILIGLSEALERNKASTGRKGGKSD